MTAVLFLASLALLGWGYYRARPLGEMGLLTWFQSVALVGPWLIFFGLLSFGLPMSIVAVLGLTVLSLGLYIWLGKKVRRLADEEQTRSPLPLKTEGDSETSKADQSDDQVRARKPIITIEPEQPPPVPAEDLQAMQGIFGVDTFFSTETIPYQDGVIFQGNLRGEADAVYAELTQKLADVLGEQYYLFLVANPDGKPVVIVLPSRNKPQVANSIQKFFAVLLAIATFGTCLVTGSLLMSFNPIEHPERLSEALPIGLGIFSVLVVHEVGHQVFARRHGVKLSWPFFFPALQLGSFGAFNRFESLVPNRTALFDVAIAGPAAGGIFSLLLLMFGFTLSGESSPLAVPSPFFRGSILVGTLARLGLGDALQAETVFVNPLVIVGWIGLIITALNLMPAGRLDGGRITQAIYGRRVTGRATAVTLIVLAIASLINPLSLYWAIVVLFLQRDLERPSLNELSEPDDTRAILGLVALFVMAAVLIPFSSSVAGRLGVGG
ncbi:MAG: site-2 protease family protein [Cyanobacteria bacterium P01_A01_bin.17]